MSARVSRAPLAPALLVALLWAPLPGVPAVWYAVRAERAQNASEIAALSARARLWLWIAVAFGFAEIAGAGAIGLLRWMVAT